MDNPELKAPNCGITVDASAGAPIWLQIRNKVIYLIRSGALKKGDRLPTIRDLAVLLDINFNTVGKAYKDLERDGIISTNRGLGTFVSIDAEAIGRFSESPVDALIEELLEIGASNGMDAEEIAFRVKQVAQKRGNR